MTRIHAGAHLDAPPGAKYLASLNFAEILPRAPLPKAATLRRFRNSLPDEFRCALVTPRTAVVSSRGALRFDAGLESGLAWFVEAADALRADLVVLDTGAELTTGPRDRELLARYVERLPRPEGRTIVWAPGGLWEPEEAIAQANALGMVYGFDPLESDAPDGPLVYARLRAMGGRSKFSEDMLLTATEVLLRSGAEDVYVAIDSPRATREAARLRALVGQVAEELAAEADEDLEDDEDWDEDEDLEDEDEDLEDEDEGSSGRP